MPLLDHSHRVMQFFGVTLCFTMRRVNDLAEASASAGGKAARKQ